MSTVSIEDDTAPPPVASAVGASAGGAPWRPGLALVAASAAWLSVAGLTQLWPDRPEGDWPYTGDFASILGAFGATLCVSTIAGRWFESLQRLQYLAPWLLVMALFVFRLGARDREARPAAAAVFPAAPGDL
jgi:NitT/TauT family transport system permease protein